MHDESPVLDLTLHIAMLAVMAVGGGVILIAPEVSHFVVGARHWLSNEQFSAAYAIAQAAPGPNLLFISFVGWLAAGWAGAICATLAVIVPSTALTLAIIKARPEGKEGRFSRALSQAFAPMSIGFLVATAWIFSQSSNADWRADALTLACAGIVLRSKLNPVMLIALGAAAGMLRLI